MGIEFSTYLSIAAFGISLYTLGFMKRMKGFIN